MSVSRWYAVVEGSQIRARHDEVHVMVRVVVLLEIQGNDLCTLQLGDRRNGGYDCLEFFSIFGKREREREHMCLCTYISCVLVSHQLRLH